MTAPIRPVAKVLPRDREILEQRARLLSAADEVPEGEGDAIRAVAFRLRGAPAALDAAVVQRTVTRLEGTIAVPLADGSERAVAFVEEHPLAVVDLAGFATGTPRRAADLLGSPALVVAAPEGAVAVAVDGPLDLLEERLVASLAPGEVGGGGIRIAGRLSGGASLLDPTWLVEWARKGDPS